MGTMALLDMNTADDRDLAYLLGKSIASLASVTSE